jgi:thymidylate synthase (FAD)
MIKATYIDHMGEDLTVVNAARVSFGKKRDVFQEQEDYRLIHYLAEHGHTSPFGHCFASFHIKAPVFVARQLVKHKFLRWNETSRRYVDDLPSYYTPKFRHAAKNKKQGSGNEMAISHQQDAVLEQSYIKAHESYKYLIKTGVCPEQARIVLPQGAMTEWYWSGSLDALADMCNLRCASDTQYETRLVATQISDEMQKLFPVSWSALVKVNGHQAEVQTEIRPFDKSERNRAKEKSKANKLAHERVQPQDLNQVWYDGDGGELYE